MTLVDAPQDRKYAAMWRWRQESREWNVFVAESQEKQRNKTHWQCGVTVRRLDRVVG